MPLRHVILLSFALLLSACAGSVEPFAPTAERTGGANQILVDVDAEPTEAYGAVVRLLAEQGYTLAASNETARVVSTEPKQFMGQHAMRVTALVSENEAGGSTITMRGSMKSGFNVGQALLGAAAAEDPEGAIEDIGQGGSPMKRGFNALDELARSLSGGSVRYARI